MKKIFLIILGLTLATPAFAQLTPGDTVNLLVYPDWPKANQTATFTLESYTIDLGKTEISWFADNKLITRGIGEKKFTYKAGPVGSTLTIVASIVTLEGLEFQKVATIRPGNVELVWESDSYTPPFYKGKALYSYQGEAVVVAVPEMINTGGLRYEASDLDYLWRENGMVVQDASGFGKNIFRVKGGVILKPARVEVEVTTLDKKFGAAGFAELIPLQPKLLLYEEHPVYGTLFNRALSGSAELGQETNETRVGAYPLFFTVASRFDPRISYDWLLNGQPVVVAEPSVTLKKPAGASGLSSLSLNVKTAGKILQTATAGLSITFWNKESGIPFFNNSNGFTY